MKTTIKKLIQSSKIYIYVAICYFAFAIVGICSFIVLQEIGLHNQILIKLQTQMFHLENENKQNKTKISELETTKNQDLININTKSSKQAQVTLFYKNFSLNSYYPFIVTHHRPVLDLDFLLQKEEKTAEKE